MNMHHAEGIQPTPACLMTIAKRHRINEHVDIKCNKDLNEENQELSGVDVTKGHPIPGLIWTAAMVVPVMWAKE